ncbi:MAG: bifunctional DNA primase/polymerase [Patescibacteria group bacterium]|nr:bifunctional DNA primase/polymerase [Patescibacteria group bacterium]
MNLSASYWLRYHDLGWSIFPVREQTKKSLVSWKKYQTKRPDRQQIESWPRLWPNANIAVATGEISGVFVLDIDRIPDPADKSAPERARIERSLALIAAVRDIETARARTAKGQHVYFKWPGRSVPTKVSFLPGLDVRGDGGYAILPPSLHPNGARYIWDDPPEDGVADAPDWLLQAIYENKSPVLESGVRADGELSWQSALAGVTEGSRNSAAAKLVGKMLAETVEELWPLQFEALRKWNFDNNRPPLHDDELKSIFDSISKKEHAKRHVGGLDFQRAIDLEREELPPPKYAVQGLVYGLTLLIAKPKSGKSELALQIASSVALGSRVFPVEIDNGDEGGVDFRTAKGPVLYLDLESTKRRLFARLKRRNMEIPADLYYTLQAPPIAEGGLKRLQTDIERLRPSLVIIDMFQTFAGVNEKSPRNAYQAEYQVMRMLWEMSNQYDTPFLALQHARKDVLIKGLRADPFDSVSGTLGSSGAADTLIVMREETTATLNRQGPKVKRARLYVRGRDLSEYEIALAGDNKTHEWKVAP